VSAKAAVLTAAAEGTVEDHRLATAWSAAAAAAAAALLEQESCAPNQL
jgi:hypothetical protein